RGTASRAGGVRRSGVFRFSPVVRAQAGAGAEHEMQNDDRGCAPKRNKMKTTVYRLNQLEGHGSWRPRSLVDMRGAAFPDEFHQLLVFDANGITQAFDQYESQLGDVIFLGEGDELAAYVAAPFGWELVKFGREWRSPP